MLSDVIGRDWSGRPLAAVLMPLAGISRLKVGHAVHNYIIFTVVNSSSSVTRNGNHAQGNAAAFYIQWVIDRNRGVSG